MLGRAHMAPLCGDPETITSGVGHGRADLTLGTDKPWARVDVHHPCVVLYVQPSCTNLRRPGDSGQLALQIVANRLVPQRRHPSSRTTTGA